MGIATVGGLVAAYGLRYGYVAGIGLDVLTKSGASPSIFGDFIRAVTGRRLKALDINSRYLPSAAGFNWRTIHVKTLPELTDWKIRVHWLD